MTLWPRTFLRRLTGRQDYLDGIRDGVLHGWALPKPGAGPVPVALYAGHSVWPRRWRASSAPICVMRGLPVGACGFSFPIETNTGLLRVCRLDGPRPVEIGRLAGWRPEPDPGPARRHP